MAGRGQGVGVEGELFELPSDRAGQLRRECRGCHRVFKIRAGALDGEAVLRVLTEKLGQVGVADLPECEPERHCPYCGVTAPEHAWLTAEQRTVVEKRADHFKREIRHVQLQHPLKTLGQNPNVTYLAVKPEPFAERVQENTDTFRAFPLLCCRETMRISAAWHGDVRCFFCGTLHEIPRVAPGFLARLDGNGLDV